MSEQNEMPVLAYRVGAVERNQDRASKRLADHDRELEEFRAKQTRMEEQITGEGGLQRSLWALRDELKDIRRGIYALTGTFIVATVTLATAIATHTL